MSETTKWRIIVLGLDEELTAELASALAGQRHILFSEPFHPLPECLSAIERLGADVVFCTSESGRYVALLDTLANRKPDLPVVIVSRAPEVAEWLDAMDAGAADYCAAPFDASQVQWILESALKNRAAPTRYRAAG